MKKLSIVLMILPAVLSSQNIPIKTVPLATGDQFLLFPSLNLSMGGVSIAVDDLLGDPFTNPAKGGRMEGIRLIATPVYYGISRNNGLGSGSTARTLPLGVLFRSESFFGGLTWARQNLKPDGVGAGVVPASVSTFSSAQENTNTYTFGMIGSRIPSLNLSVGASVFWADLMAMDGVQYLYASDGDLRQSGYVADYRIGLVGQLPEDRSYEVVFSHHKTDMQHEITTSGWGPIPFDVASSFIARQIITRETHLDQTSGFGVKLGYQQPFSGSWRIGGLFVSNWKSHPKIPNYELMNIPRDPGNSIAYNVGVGLSTRGKQVIFGFDLIYEPIASNTWADATAPIVTPGGATIPAGGKTVENSFDFYNYVGRVGFRTFNRKVDFSLGANLHRIRYYMKQTDFVRGFSRKQKEEWSEFTFSVGLGFGVFGSRVKYTGLFTTGTGRPGVANAPWDDVRLTNWANALTADFLLAPSGRLIVDDAIVGTHQISIMVEID